MSKRVMIEVTAEQIALATKANSGHCMIADAIAAAIPDARGVSVDLQTIRYSTPKEGKRRIYLTPLKCQEKLLMFDQGVEVQPWSFRMPSPMQITPMRCKVRLDEAGSTGPRREGPKSIRPNPSGRGNNRMIVEGGHPPKVAVLSNARGQRRVFGIKAAKGFDPSQPDRVGP